MIVPADKFKEACQTILLALDTKEVTLYNEALELAADGNVLNMNVTNRQYYVTVRFNLSANAKFKAVVKAKTFLSLISKITTDFIELLTTDKALTVKANGEYQYNFPIIFNNSAMLELPKIELGIITNEFPISSDILLSILFNNSKELARGADAIRSNNSRTAQQYYYIDEQGAITYTTGACVNTFSLPTPIKILLDEKSVRLFKLFKGNTTVDFKMSQVALPGNLIQTVIQFRTDDVIVNTIMPDSSLISSVPAINIRETARKNYPFSISLYKDDLAEALNRLNIFNTDSMLLLRVTFNLKTDVLTLQSLDNEFTEKLSITGGFIGYKDDEFPNDEYSFYLVLKNIKRILDGYDDEYITMNFGDHKAVVFKKQEVVDILPEPRLAN